MATLAPTVEIAEVLEPMYDRIIVRQDDEKKVLKELEGESGQKIELVAADEFAEKPLQGTVLAVGCGRLLPDGSLNELRIKAGDRIIFGRHTGADIPEDLGLGKNLKMMREDEVMAVRKDGRG